MEARISLLCSKELATGPHPGHMNPVHNFATYFFKIHFNIILSSFPMYSKWSLPFRFSNQNFECLISPMCATWPTISSSLILSPFCSPHPYIRKLYVCWETISFSRTSALWCYFRKLCLHYPHPNQLWGWLFPFSVGTRAKIFFTSI